MAAESADGSWTALVIDSDPRSAPSVTDALQDIGAQAWSARTLTDAWTLLPQTQPQLVVVSPTCADLEPHMDFAVAARRQYGAHVVVVLDRVDAPSIDTLAAGSVSSVLCRPVHRAQLEVTLRMAAAVNASPQSRASGTAASSHVVVGASGATAGSRLDGLATRLTPRERQVVVMLLQHHRVPSIATRLGISQQTVRNHLKRVFKRTGTTSQQELLDLLNGGNRR